MSEMKNMLVKITELQDAMNAKQEEVKRLQEQVLDNQKDQLAVLQSRIQVLLTQTYELHEYPTSRLFVVLPQDPSRWDTVNPFSNKFQLYFLCECGEHTKSINSRTKIPYDIHLAKHEGYEITRPSEFFQQYGSYALTILKALKFGITVVGVALSALSHLINVESIDQATAGLKKLQENIVPGVDQIIGHIDNVMVQGDVAIDETGDQMKKQGGTGRRRSTQAGHVLARH